MRKLMILIIVLVVAAVAQGGISQALTADFPIDNIAQIQSSDGTLYVKCDDGSAFIVYIETYRDEPVNNSPAYDMCLLSGGNIALTLENGLATTQCSISDVLPKPTTIISLALGGFLLRRKKRKVFTSLPLYI